MSDYTGLFNYYGLGDVSTGMVVDCDAYGVPIAGGPAAINYRNYHWKVQNDMYARWVKLNDARDTTSDLTNLCGVKDGPKPFQDDWFGVYPHRRRQRKAYPDEILNIPPA